MSDRLSKQRPTKRPQKPQRNQPNGEPAWGQPFTVVEVPMPEPLPAPESKPKKATKKK